MREKKTASQENERKKPVSRENERKKRELRK
jgi:hypothetical protein